MTRNRAVKFALAGYAQANRVPVPAGFNPRSDGFGRQAFELTKRVQAKAGLRPDGNIGPYTLLAIGKFMPGKSVGEKAAWCMVAMEGALETGGNNIGASVQAIQKLGSELNPGAWPWCAATTSWALRCAGWEHWGEFVRREPEAWVQGWVDAAKAKKYGMSVVHWTLAKPGDFECFEFDGSYPVDHIGAIRSRPNLRTGSILTVEGNTSDGQAGSQADGAGLWRRERNAKPPSVIVRVS